MGVIQFIRECMIASASGLVFSLNSIVCCSFVSTLCEPWTVSGSDFPRSIDTREDEDIGTKDIGSIRQDKPRIIALRKSSLGIG